MTLSLTTFLGYLVQILPATLLLVFLFKDNLRLSGPSLILALCAIVLIPDTFFTLCSGKLPNLLTFMPVEQVRFLCFAFFMMLTYLFLIPLFAESLSRKLFFFGIVCNYSQIISTLALIIEVVWMHQTSSTASFFSGSNTVLSLWLLVFTFPFVYYILTRRYPVVLSSIDDRIWARLAFFSVVEFGMLSFAALSLPAHNLDAFALIAMTSIIVGVIMMYVYVYAILSSAWKQKNQELAEEAAQSLLSMQIQRSKALNQAVSEARRNRHDLRHHLQTLSTLAAADTTQSPKDQLASIRQYLDNYTTTVSQTDFVILCKNPTVDGLLNYYRSAALSHNIKFECQASLPEATLIPDPVLCVILGNLLENATDAARLVADIGGDADIAIKLRIISNQLIIAVDNTFDGHLEQRGGQFYSTKAEGSGLGVDNVRMVCENYGGHAVFSAKDQRFHVSVVLPLSTRASSATSD